MRILLITFIFFFTITASCQKEFKGGIMIGPVTSQISGDGLGGWDKFGLVAGAWVTIPLSEKAGISLAMKFVNKGSRTDQDTINFQSFGYYLNYIDMPVLFNYIIKQKTNSAFVLNAGPYIGYTVKQIIVANGNEYDIPIPFNSYDVGFEVGASWWLTPKFYTNLMITSSVLPTRPNPAQVNPLSYYERGNYNQTIQFTLGLRFGGNTTQPSR